MKLRFLILATVYVFYINLLPNHLPLGLGLIDDVFVVGSALALTLLL